MSQPVGRQPFVVWGMRIGGALGAVGLVPVVLTFAGAALDTINALTTGTVGLALLAFLAGGVVTARATGEINSGALAGLLAGATFAAVSGLGNIALAMFDGPAYGALLFAGQPAVGAGQLVLLSIIRTLTVMLVYAGVGAGVGGLGALLARSRAR